MTAQNLDMINSEIEKALALSESPNCSLEAISNAKTTLVDFLKDPDLPPSTIRAIYDALNALCDRVEKLKEELLNALATALNAEEAAEKKRRAEEEATEYYRQQQKKDSTPSCSM